MNNKPVIYGVIGFISGVIFTIFISILGMSGMMWGMGGMMDGWFRGRCENYNSLESPENYLSARNVSLQERLLSEIS